MAYKAVKEMGEKSLVETGSMSAVDTSQSSNSYTTAPEGIDSDSNSSDESAVVIIDRNNVDVTRSGSSTPCSKGGTPKSKRSISSP